MNSVQWDRHSYLIGGKPVFLVSGEFHYFRVPREDWRARLQLWKEAGGNCVATYIPWILHEPAEGDIRFGDMPQRDLEGFLALCREMELYVVARPGPYQYSELKYDGLPGWLCDGYPQILAHTIEGKPFRASSVSYLHPVFLEKAKAWFDAVCPIIARHTVSRGGAVAFAQFDNELTGIHAWFAGLDYNREAMGIGREGGRFPTFLQSRYADVAALNESWGTAFASFAEAQPIAPAAVRTAQDSRRAKDYQDFYLASIADYAETLVGWMRGHGIDCPMVHNAANPGMNTNFLETVERLGGDFLLGSDHYYNLDANWPQNNPTPQYAEKIFYSNEVLRSMGYPATVFELPGGSCSDWPPITAEDLRVCYLTNTAFGMKGQNYYIFTGGPNPEGLGAFSESYDYNASVGARGEIRPSYGVQKEFGMMLARNPWMARAERVADCNIGLIHEYSRAREYDRAGEGFRADAAINFLHKGLVTTALCASFSPNLIALDGDLQEAQGKPLMVVSATTMAEGIQRALVRFVQDGGKLLIAPVLPHLDENYRPCTVLRDFLGAGDSAKLTVPEPTLHVGPVRSVLVNGSLWGTGMPEDATELAREEKSGACISWGKRFPDGGQVILLGLEWLHNKMEHVQMLQYLLSELDCTEQAVQCSNPCIWTSLRSDGEKTALFLMNLFTAPMEAEVSVKRGAEYRCLGTQHLNAMDVQIIQLD